MLKKALSAALAAMAVTIPITGITGNAAFISYDNTKQYNAMIEELNGYKQAPELCDAISENLFTDGRGYCSGVWRLDNGDNPNKLGCWLEYRYYDTLNLSFNDAEITVETVNALLDELEIPAEVARASKPYTDPRVILPDGLLSQLPASSVVVYFYDDDNSSEYCERITNALEGKYRDKLVAASGEFNVYEFTRNSFRWDIFYTQDVETHSLEALTPEQYQTINKDLSEKGYDIHVEIENENKRKLVISENYSEQEKFGLATMLRENYGIVLYQYTETDTQNPGKKVDFLADGVEGDANLDGKASVADSVAILQHIANRDKYGLKAQGLVNADVDGIEGVTANDALVLQQWDAGIR